MPILMMVAALAAAAQTPRFDPRALKGDVAGGASEVMVLGTPHLSGLPPAFEPAQLGPLLDRLAAWMPQVVTIEALTGAQCEHFRRYPARFNGTFEQYCWDPAPARAATGLDVPAATDEAERLLAALPAAPTPAQRRHLAAVLLAAGDPASATVQWLRLPSAERHAGDGLDARLATFLDARPTKRNEDYLIGAALAARVRLERVFPVDDHSADAVIDDTPAFDAAMQRIWTAGRARRGTEDARLEAGIARPGGLIALYRAYNAPSQARIVFDTDFGLALKDRTPGLPGRRYADWWQVRNLRMVANIMAAAATRPGGRVLCIVGASHKGYYEAYLDQMHDMTIADAQAVLR